MGYIYQADTYCDGCGDEIRAEIADPPADPNDEHTYDSDEYPKVADVENEEADAPCHCARCHAFLHNPLTGDGYGYVQEALQRAPLPLSDVLQEWADEYSFELVDGQWVSDEMESLA